MWEDELMFMDMKLVKDYRVTDECNSYLVGKKIVDMFALQNIGIEGGLTIIFESDKDKQRGILVLGYNELGEWITFLQVGANQIVSLKYYDSEVIDSINHLIKEYQII